MSAVLRPVEDDRALLDRLDFEPGPLCCELPHSHDTAATAWVICRSCDHHVASCDLHVEELRELFAGSDDVGCVTCGRHSANLDQAVRVEPIGAA